ncbi:MULTISPECIES: hypothetical protein [Pseudomonas]|uniref:Uncharacterized protein n=1 Tax=Pseudomonas delhiensis TaxID=366289 RepID=A0A239M3J1_9PSED|nr:MULTISPECIES: hypothetical protein [Pseudomonas]MED5609055.1 hypothetical protein [Pseudomonas sp. JH-2]PWU28786.1 hypothetical protein DK254_23570 [Pseudomonas sp. RW407]SDJ39454.1 hypothetical protein SAMN05216189_101671 [Pseudomonas delhiensis]SNT36822.1 hypothetical protein SAMN06295949_12371 [Pseudomonas delhiensis]
MPEAKLEPLQHQSYEDVLFVNPNAPANHLFEAAESRLSRLEDMLRVLENHEGSDVLVMETARIASALAPLAGEAKQLYALAHQAR